MQSQSLQMAKKSRHVRSERGVRGRWADERLAPPQWLREAAMLGIRDLDLGIDPAAWSADEEVLRTW